MPQNFQQKSQNFYPRGHSFRYLEVSTMQTLSLTSLTSLTMTNSPWVSEWVKSFSHVWLFATPWTVAYQAPPSMGFSRQEYWSGLSLASRLISMEPNFHILQENQNAHFRFPGGETEHTWPTMAWEHNNEISYWTDNMYGVSTMCQACAKQFTHVIFITTSRVRNKYLLST